MNDNRHCKRLIAQIRPVSRNGASNPWQIPCQTPLILESKSMKSMQCTKSVKFKSKSQNILLSQKISNIHTFTALSAIKKHKEMAA